MRPSIRRAALLACSGVVFAGLTMLSLWSTAYAAPVGSTSTARRAPERARHQSVVVDPERPPNLTLRGSVPPMPSPEAPMGAWQAWASAQRLAAEHTDVGKQLAAQGYRLTSPVYLLPVGRVPGMGMPAGITTYAIAYSAVPVSHVSSANDPSTCGSIGGPGAACSSAQAVSGGAEITASYQYNGG